MKQINWRKSNKILITCTSGRNLEKLGDLPNDWTSHLKYHLQWKTKEDVRGGGLGLQRGGRYFTWIWKSKCLINKSLLGHEEKAMATHSSTLAWKIPWTEGPGRLQSMGLLEVGYDWRLHFYVSVSCTREGNGNPLQYSCLENPRDRGAWWAAVYAVAQSRTRLKQLSSSSSSSSSRPSGTQREIFNRLF